MLIVTAEEMYDMDHAAINDIGIDGKLLMENAGRAMSDRLEAGFSKTDRIQIMAGSGNNGGDGFVIARTLLNKGWHVSVAQVVPDHKISGDALYHKNILIRCGGSVHVTQEIHEIEVIVKVADVLVDAILGVGVKGTLREPLGDIVTMMNESETYIVSVDLPSGLPANEGVADFQAVQANETIIAGSPKMSAFLASTSSYYGEWSTVSFGLPAAVTANQVQRRIWTQRDFQATMPVRQRHAHKGSHGSGLVIGGSTAMPGSVAMTSEAALRAGAGLITTATAKDVIPTVAAHCMEATYLKLDDTDGFLNSQTTIPFADYDAAVLGMGMGRYAETGALVQQAVEAAGTLIVDADGLHHLKPLLTRLPHRKDPVVLTPHPGEMAMLLGITVNELLLSPFAYSKAFAKDYQVFLVLKGMFTIITTPEGAQTVITAGNQGLAKGGTGDVLSGIMLAMIMQQQTVHDAVCNACFVHGKAAERLTEQTHSFYDLMASDVIIGMADVYRTFLTEW